MISLYILFLESETRLDHVKIEENPRIKLNLIDKNKHAHLINKPFEKTHFSTLLDKYFFTTASFYPSNGFEERARQIHSNQLRQTLTDNQNHHPYADDESNVKFNEHIFIKKAFWESAKTKYSDKLSIFSNKDVKNFMNLVLESLSNNKYITLKEKYSYLDYFIDFFDKNIHLIN